MFALVVLGVLAAGAGFVALQQHRLGQNSRATARAMLEARSSADLALVQWNAAGIGSLRVGQTRPLAGASVRRLSGTLFFIEGLSRDWEDGTEQRYARLAQVDVPRLPAAAALVLSSAPDAGVLAGIEGGDVRPGGWVCDGDTISSVSVQLYDSATTGWVFGSWSWERLRSWPASASRADSFELRWSPGDLRLGSERLLGAVVVEGDLVLSGASQVVGVALVRGSIVAENLGGSLVGTAVAEAARLGGGATAGALRARFSSCAVRAALAALAPVRPLPVRSGLPLR